jgi:hypothetical protein
MYYLCRTITKVIMLVVLSIPIFLARSDGWFGECGGAGGLA